MLDQGRAKKLGFHPAKRQFVNNFHHTHHIQIFGHELEDKQNTQPDSKRKHFTSEYQRNYEEHLRKLREQQTLKKQYEEIVRDQYPQNQYQSLHQFAQDKKRQNLQGYYAPEYETVKYQPFTISPQRYSRSLTRGVEREQRGTQPSQIQISNQNINKDNPENSLQVQDLQQQQQQLQNRSQDEQIQANIPSQEDYSPKQNFYSNQFQEQYQQSTHLEQSPPRSPPIHNQYQPHNQSQALSQEQAQLPPQEDYAEQDQQLLNQVAQQSQLEQQQANQEGGILPAMPFGNVPGNSEEQVRYIKRLNAATKKQDFYYQTYLNSHLMTEKDRYRLIMEMQSNPHGGIVKQKTPRRPLGKIVTQIEMNNAETRKHLKEVLDQQIQEKKHRQLIESAKIKAFQKGMLDQQMKYSQEIAHTKSSIKDQHQIYKQYLDYQRNANQDGGQQFKDFHHSQQRLLHSHQRYDQTNNYDILSGNIYDSVQAQLNMTQTQNKIPGLPPRPHQPQRQMGNQQAQRTFLSSSYQGMHPKNLSLQMEQNYLPGIQQRGPYSLTPQNKMNGGIPKTPMYGDPRVGTSISQERLQGQGQQQISQQYYDASPQNRSLTRPQYNSQENLRGYSSHKQLQNAGLQMMSNGGYQYE